MGEIIDFKAKLKDKEVENFDAIIEDREELVRDIVETSLGMSVDILDSLEELGYPVKKYDYHSDIFLVVESIKSLMHKSVDIEFPMQTVAESLFNGVDIDPESFDDIFT